MLEEIIIQKIKSEGPISFHDFMEMALYHPEYGYYVSGRNKVGFSGDYYTSPTLTPLFGEMIGRQLVEMWKLMHHQPFTIVEFGGNTGTLASSILQYLSETPRLYKDLRYYIVEKNIEANCVPYAHEKIRWVENISEPVVGCVLANEVVDNFAVHKVIMQEELMEVFVDYKDRFLEFVQPAPDELKQYLQQLNIELPGGYSTEINLDAIKWLGEVTACLKKGFVLTIDYGFSSKEYYDPFRSKGTLICYNQHMVNENPYIKIGEQDITAHVNFSALHHWGTKCGLQLCGFTDQARFLMGLGLTEHILSREKLGGKKSQEIGTLFRLLSGMGRKFKVFIQQKGLQNPVLSGLRFGQLGL